MLNIGIQLYTVRDSVKEDMAKALADVKTAGYQGVEFAGYFNYTPTQIKDMLAAADLKMVGSHVGWDRMENFESEIEYILENKAPYFTVPGLSKELWVTYDAAMQTIEKLSKYAEKAATYNVPLSYHNHAWEFDSPYENGKNFHDLLLENAPNVHIELDTGWSAAAGVDNASYIKKLGSRLDLIHIKDIYLKDMEDGTKKNTPTEIGTGFVDVPATLKAAESVGVTWGVVEQDIMEKYPLSESIRKSFAYLQTVNL